ncbi:MAG: sigma 54-interacting transcriptional regulator [Bacteroidetes bacterium]|nr:sigma 54-interacting transcriptional regulator [Bacteroidota bacterium]
MNDTTYKNIANLSENTLLLKKVLDLSLKGLQVVDENGIIMYVNESFETIHNVKAENVIGRHVTEVIENTRMHIVAKTGIEERDDLQLIHGHEYVVSRIPIIDDQNSCLGVIGVIRFEYTEQLKVLTKKVEKLEQELKNFAKKNVLHSDTSYGVEDIIAVADSSRRAKEVALRGAISDSTVLLLGESGVGKEVYAQSIHNLSKRNKGPFIRMNCSAIQESLFESELFGYEDGAFTGARKGGKKGKFELAHSGTIFLDEIGDMPIHTQSKLLRVIQEREIERLGSEKTTEIDVRIIAATNQNLELLVDQKKFRSDLYYRLNVIPITIPPLRNRILDIPVIVKKIWEELQKKRGVYYKTLDYSAYAALEKHNWPGNIRELKNVLERVMAVVSQDTITGNHIQTIIQGQQNVIVDFCLKEDCNLSKLIQQTERGAISMALARSNNNRSQAAKILGISRALLYKRMNEFNMV